ncbi:MAG: hypothetical protein AMS26_10975 [Bacteroides sp. SM23_62]|nr:MAG: hypothetical protein AMS26_10975 [Bacteroides sp. SM23_62]
MYWYLYPDWQKYAFRTCGSWSEDCQLIDIDCDGDNDVINGNGQGLYWYENPLNTGGIIGAGKWTEHAIGSDGTNIHDLEIADLNGDVDMVLGNIWLENKGKGTDWEEHAYAGNKDVGDLWIEYTIESHITHIHGLAIGDFNKDGYLDIHTSIRHDHPGPRDHVSIWLSSGKEE